MGRRARDEEAAAREREACERLRKGLTTILEGLIAVADVLSDKELIKARPALMNEVLRALLEWYDKFDALRGKIDLSEQPDDAGDGGG